MTARAKLRSELTRRLLPALQRAGFDGPAAIAGNALLHDFKRKSGDVTHVLTVQLEKRGLPRFILNLAIEPYGATVLQGRVQPKRGATTRAWFRADPPLLKRLIGRGATREVQAVDSCLALLPEVERWWNTQAASEHITVLPIRFTPSEPR